MSPRSDGKTLALLNLLPCLWVGSNFVEFRHSGTCGPHRIISLATRGSVLERNGNGFRFKVVQNTPKKAGSAPESGSANVKSDALHDLLLGVESPGTLQKPSSVLERVGNGFRFKVVRTTPEKAGSTSESVLPGEESPSTLRKPSSVLQRIGNSFRFKVDHGSEKEEERTKPATDTSARGDVLRNGLLVAAGIALGLQVVNSSREEAKKKREEEENMKRGGDAYLAVLPLVAGGALFVQSRLARLKAERTKQEDEVKQFGYMW
eukprot:CAMPEP_0117526754 /NCGR_PEP_ID=MMETSP0784-20121206/36447_1 /TAXON_ID=39447 /ORGANISM="" /LENGTH=262 /DNA_ID=CAMNT_0005322989 /DNA_START=44 /DNA_END=829 /DNA_ORIENTATION=+